MYLHTWIATAFNDRFKIETILRIWDALLGENDFPTVSVELLVHISAALVLLQADKLKTAQMDEMLQSLLNLSASLEKDKLEEALGDAYRLMATTRSLL